MNPYWPRSGERASDWTERTSMRSISRSVVSTSSIGLLLTALTNSAVNILPITAATCSSWRAPGARPSRRAAMSACSVSGTSSSSTDPARREEVAVAGQQAAVHEHADRLDRVQRDAGGALEDAVS